jgi:hypothetical protein
LIGSRLFCGAWAWTDPNIGSDAAAPRPAMKVRRETPILDCSLMIVRL